MNTTARNQFARQFVSKALELAGGDNESFFTQNLNQENYFLVSALLTDLIEVPSMGFRGVVVTAITGMAIDSSYNPLIDFYGSNPRSIYEQGIYFALSGKVPCGKSDPLNVAKNIKTLDEGWVSGKRPEKSARAAVDFLKIYLDSNNTQKQLLQRFFFFRLWRYGQSVQKTKAVDIEEGLSRVDFGRLLTEFSIKHANGGQTPQLIFKLVVECLLSDKPKVSVLGGEESVFGTNTTSKKPADIWIEFEGVPETLYEVTVKKIDEKRLHDSVESVAALNLLNADIIFVCRIPQDITDLTVTNRKVEALGKTIQFLDFEEFMIINCALLSNLEIKEIQNCVKEYINDIQTPITVKNGWNLISQSF